MAMTDEKCRFILDLYALALNELRPHHPDSAAHIATMLPKMRDMLDQIAANGGAAAVDVPVREKFMRWLGFVQGVFYSTGVYTIEQMKAHNRPEPLQLGQDWVTKVTSADDDS